MLKAFDSTLQGTNNAIRLLCDLKLDFKADPYNFIGQMRTMKAAFSSLDIKVEDIQRYFVWNALNSRFQTHITHITNKSSPSFQEIEDSFFEATDRYLKEQKLSEKRDKVREPPPPRSIQSENNSTNFAVNISQTSKSKFCPLCAKDKKNKDHDIKFCPIYDTASKKISKLIEINGCRLCGYGNHDSTRCCYKFPTKCKK